MRRRFSKVSCALLVVILLALSFGAAAQDVLALDTKEGPLEAFDHWFGENVVSPLGAVLFFKVGLPDTTDADGNTVVRAVPFIVLFLFLGGLFFTFRYSFVNLRLFKHSFDVIRGKYDDPKDAGEVTHFRALTSALSATVGLGNIAGVAVAISLGGPGAAFWMWWTAFFGMTLKFSECTLSLLYRRIHPDGRVLGGPMITMITASKDGGPAMQMAGKVFAYMFAVLCVFATFGGGNMFQTNQTASIIVMQLAPPDITPAQEFYLKLGIGVFMAAMTGAVIIGGVSRIGQVTSLLVPFMCIFYCGVCLTIIALNLEKVPGMFADIFTQALRPEAMYGGLIGVIVQGMRRAAFSNEAGMGSSAIIHAAAKTDEPVREGVVAMIEPFIDTIVVCTMSALAVLITGAYLEEGLEGVQIMATAFDELGPVFPYLLILAVFTFAYSTLISWGYYGERAIEFLAGPKGILPYRCVYVLVVLIGPLPSLTNVLDFCDMTLLAMCFPNLIGMVVLSGKVRAMTQDYIRRLKSGEMKPHVS